MSLGALALALGFGCGYLGEFSWAALFIFLEADMFGLFGLALGVITAFLVSVSRVLPRTRALWAKRMVEGARVLCTLASALIGVICISCTARSELELISLGLFLILTSAGDVWAREWVDLGELGDGRHTSLLGSPEA
jgi:hypothetical protein